MSLLSAIVSVAFILIIVIAGFKLLDFIASIIMVHRHDRKKREREARQATGVRILKGVQEMNNSVGKIKPWVIMDQIEGEPAREGRLYPNTGLIIMELAEEQQRFSADKQTDYSFTPRKIDPAKPHIITFHLRSVYNLILAQGWFYVSFPDNRHYETGHKLFFILDDGKGFFQETVSITWIEKPYGTNLHKIFFEPLK